MGKAEQVLSDEQRLSSPPCEASKMLEAALQQMDGIISGAKLESPNNLAEAPSPQPAAVSAPLAEAAVHLANVVRQCSTSGPAPPPDPATAAVLRHWLSAMPGMSPVELEERIRRLEADKESLQLQVSCLTEQIDAQAHKIRDLERTLDDRNKQLASAHDLLQREMLSRSSLETQKLELFSALSELKLQLAASERENFELRERRRSFPGKPPSTRVVSQSPQPSPSPVSLIENSPRRLGAHPHSLEDFKDLSQPRTPPATYRRTVEHYGSLPRTTSRGSSTTTVHPPSTPQHSHSVSQGTSQGGSPPRKGVVFAETEPIVIEDRNGFEETDIPSDSSGYGRIKRSGSGSLDELASPEGPGEFRRGGVRATAGPRLGWSAPGPPALPFTDWDSAAVCLWLQHLGLDCYVHDASKWVKSGAQLLSASPGDVDKELGIKNPLHRKKLQLALLAQQPSIVALDPLLEPASLLDTAWVLRWLDDQGLPQHKEAFLAARADGRTLHRLTTDDLYHLHVTSSLHVASLRRGIQVLRENGFNSNCLERRSQPTVVNGGETCPPPPPTPEEVSRWSNHRVMEWLRVVDLAEYAPNLRGSGVHGGLLMYESRFTAELLACLLSIPAGKTLLRRHLNTHFNQLLGKDCIQEKRDAETTLGYIPLTPTTKLKVAKKSQFTLKRKKSKSELDFGDLVCPLDPKSGDGPPNSGDGTIRSITSQRIGAAYRGIDSDSIGSPRNSPLPERTTNV